MRSLKGLNVGGANPEKRSSVGKGKKEKEVELKSSAAVPCHISAEHDSRTVKCGNALGSSPRIQTRLPPLRILHGPGYPTAGSERRTLTWCFVGRRRSAFGWQKCTHGGRRRDSRAEPRGRTATRRNLLSGSSASVAVILSLRSFFLGEPASSIFFPGI